MGMLMSAEDARRFAQESQLKNFDSSGDMASAAQQLQNFKPGQVAITTPDKKRASILRVPEWPEDIERHRDQDRIITQAKELHGVMGLSPDDTDGVQDEQCNEESSFVSSSDISTDGKPNYSDPDADFSVPAPSTDKT